MLLKMENTYHDRSMPIASMMSLVYDDRGEHLQAASHGGKKNITTTFQPKQNNTSKRTLA